MPVLQYKLKWKSGQYADISLETWSEKAGRVSIVSDWGSWYTSWGSMGGSIRDFLLRIDNGYLRQNLHRGRPDYFDDEATEVEIKKAILEVRRGTHDYSAHIWDKEQAREVWDEVEELFGNGFQTSEGYFHAVFGGDYKFMDLYDDPPCPPCVEGYPPGLMKFTEEVWPHFLDILRKEKDGDKDRPTQRV